MSTTTTDLVESGRQKATEQSFWIRLRIAALKPLPVIGSERGSRQADAIEDLRDELIDADNDYIVAKSYDSDVLEAAIAKADPDTQGLLRAIVQKSHAAEAQLAEVRKAEDERFVVAKAEQVPEQGGRQQLPGGGVGPTSMSRHIPATLPASIAPFLWCFRGRLFALVFARSGLILLFEKNVVVNGSF